MELKVVLKIIDIRKIRPKIMPASVVILSLFNHNLVQRLCNNTIHDAYDFVQELFGNRILTPDSILVM